MQPQVGPASSVRFCSALVWVTIAAGCSKGQDTQPTPTVPSAPPTPSALTTSIDGRPPAVVVNATPLFKKFECNRCHDGTSLKAAPQEKHCVQCHQAIIAGTFTASAKALKRWQANITSIPVVPSLAHMAKRFRRDWIKGFLLRPYDVRPQLPATMPRFAMTAAEAQAIAAHLVPTEASPVTFASSDIVAGAALFSARGCNTCHSFRGAGIAAVKQVGSASPRPPTAVSLAPDLTSARRRLQSGALVAWIQDPSKFDPRSLMPASGLTKRQATQVAAYIMLAPIATPKPIVGNGIPKRLPLLKRKVSWDQVAKAVFVDTCWHCHSDPDFTRGDGGPGNTGGFGFKAKGLNLASYEGISSGSLDSEGDRHSVFAKGADGISRIIRHLLARHAEVAGKVIPGVRGMPLGLPPRTMKQIQLVESWIAQGRPR